MNEILKTLSRNVLYLYVVFINLIKGVFQAWLSEDTQK